MSKVTDPRKPYNQLHAFLDIVAIAVLAMLCSTDDWAEIESWGNAFKEWLSTLLTLKNGIPSHDTFNRVFLEWMQGVVVKIKGVMAIGGKTVRRSHDGKTKKSNPCCQRMGQGTFAGSGTGKS